MNQETPKGNYLVLVSVQTLSKNGHCIKNSMLSFGSSMQSHAESDGNYVKKSFLDPTRAKSYEKSELGHIRTDC